MSPVSSWVRSVCGASCAFAMMLVLIPAVASATTIEVAEGTGADAAGCGVGASAPCRTIQYAVNAAGTGDTVHVGPGTYEQQVDVTKSLTIRGSGPDATRILAPPQASLVSHGVAGEYPVVTGRTAGPLTVADLEIDGAHHGFSTANCPKNLDGVHFYRVGGSLDNVYITGIRSATISPDDCGNPVLGYLNTAGTVDWRISNSRIDDSRVGSLFDASIGGGVATATLVGNTIMGPATPFPSDVPPVGVSLFGVTASVDGNTFKHFSCVFAPPTGCGPDPFTQFAGIPLLLAGVRSGSAITNNTFSDNDTGVIANGDPGKALTVSGNSFVNSRAYSFLGSGGDLTVSANQFDGGGTGVFLVSISDTTPVTAALVGNTITGTDRAIYVTRRDPTGATPIGSGSANRIFGNDLGLGNATPNVFAAENDWWGCNTGPGQPGCDTVTGLVDTDPWLVLGLSADPGTIPLGGTSALTASLVTNSNGEAAGGAFPDGTPIAMATDLGTIDAQAATSAGRAASVLTSGPAGTARVSATLDNQSATTPVTVTGGGAPAPPPCSNAIKGSGKSEKLVGTDAGDVIKGKSGDDKINGLAGEDCLSGGPGDDRIKARDGEVDHVNCGSGDDQVKADNADVVKKNCEKVKAKP
jgi:hypothetical protein